MLINLVKKDFILVKKRLIIMLIFAIGAPIFIAHEVAVNTGGFLELFLTALFTVFLLFNTVSFLEDKYKGATLLSATPYTRKSLVQAKYLFVLAVFLACYIVYTLTAMLAPINIPMPNLHVVGIVLLIITIFMGTLIPVQYQFGYEKTKYIFVFFVFITPFVLPYIINWAQANSINISLASPTIVQDLLSYFLALIIGYFSMKVSVYVYSKKNL